MDSYPSTFCKFLKQINAASHTGPYIIEQASVREAFFMLS